MKVFSLKTTAILLCVTFASVAAAGQGDVFPKGFKKASKEFQSFLAKELNAETKKWKTERLISDTTYSVLGGVRPPTLTTTQPDKQGVIREEFAILNVPGDGRSGVNLRKYRYAVAKYADKKRKREACGGITLLTAKRPSYQDYRDFDAESVEALYAYRAPKADGGYSDREFALMLQFAAFLYDCARKPDSPFAWAGNRVLTHFVRYKAKDTELVSQVHDFIRKRHKFGDDAKLVILKTGPEDESLRRHELAPEDQADARKQAWEKWCGDGIGVAVLHASRTWEGKIGRTWQQLKEEIDRAIKYSAGSDVLAHHQGMEEMANGLRSKEKAALLRTSILFWKERIDQKAKNALELRTEATEAYRKALSTWDVKKRYVDIKAWEEAEQQYLRLVPAPPALKIKGRQNPADPNVGNHYYRLGVILHRLAEPNKHFNACSRERKARAGYEAFEVARWAYGNSPSARIYQAQLHMMLQENAKARKVLDSVLEGKGTLEKSEAPEESRKRARTWLKQIDANEIKRRRGKEGEDPSKELEHNKGGD